MVVKTVWYRWRERHIDQWNRIKNLKIEPQTYIPKWFLEKVQKQFHEGKIAFQHNGAGTTGQQ